MKLHRKIKHNEKVCRAHDLGSYAQGQGCNQVIGQNLVSAITQNIGVGRFGILGGQGLEYWGGGGGGGGGKGGQIPSRHMTSFQHHVSTGF